MTLLNLPRPETLRNIFHKSTAIPVVLGSKINGLGIVRSFAVKGILSICVDSYRGLTFYSKYSYGILCPNPVNRTQRFIDFLAVLGRRLPSPGVLFPTNDEWMIPISKHEEMLSKWYRYSISSWHVIKRACDKQSLYDVASRAHIPIPKTLFFGSTEEVRHLAQRISFPAIMKPAVTVGFLERLQSRGRVLPIHSWSDLEQWIDRIEQAGLSQISGVLQEIIPGGPENLFTFTAYSNRSGRVIAHSTGHKIRQYPPEAGTICSGRLERNQKVIELGTKLINTLKVYGISNTEFKRDVRTGDFFLVEINPRAGKWTYSATSAGLNLPYLAYRGALGNDVASIKEGRYGKVWLSYEDLFLALIGYRMMGFPKYSMTFNAWQKSVKGTKVWAVLDRKDPLPLFAGLTYSAYQIVKRMWKNA
jgi:predicted ATP-grasp superfamily ATP-dependent carboligase